MLEQVDTSNDMSYDEILSFGILLGTEVEYVPDMKKNKEITKERQVIEKVKTLLLKKVKLLDKQLEKAGKFKHEEA